MTDKNMFYRFDVPLFTTEKDEPVHVDFFKHRLGCKI